MATPSPGKMIRSKPSTPSIYPYTNSRRSRGTSQVQRLQSTPEFIDVYAYSPLSKGAPGQEPPTGSTNRTPVSPPHFILPTLAATVSAYSSESASSTDPFGGSVKESERPRWSGGPGFGMKHINDPMPFTLWDDERRKFRHHNKKEGLDILSKFKAESVGFYGYLMILQVETPPKPVPLTVACMPAIFTPVGQEYDALPDLIGRTGYVIPNNRDACPHLTFPRYVSPTTDQMVAVLQELSRLMNIVAITFLPDSILVQLDTDDGRKYEQKSLPASAAGHTLTYHHSKTSFNETVRKYARQRLLDPSTYIESFQSTGLPQDRTDYLKEENGGLLTPGIRLSTGPPPSEGMYANVTQSSTCGVRVKHGNKFLVTASNHSFLTGNDVYHPSENGEKIGEIVLRYEELDLAFIQMTPAHAERFTNAQYFQANPPSRLGDTDSFSKGSWFEVDSMSTGLLSLLYLGTAMHKPRRPPGHPAFGFHQWIRNPVCRVFGAMTPQMMEGMCGAPIVEVDTGKVAGFFHLADGENAMCAGMSDLLAESIDLA